ncbi:hypothetical protein AAA799E16_00231 [Marine Group I thaumarchaeote SCGC AAA799-E16]|uniref:Uncharacterized protein n=2 Tax=Marine Group I TaxID=905826 RepID=A0A087S186_9ARCH|nr:hypothetical protein AAA799E16_00231 [Marine Group I thaumarchaeote SCGC AAA799-E16]KFM19490.1 hypothetical protein SCCGRSA3_00415 [Marine Group I thaumarchaeote SCGC RSA3]
MSTKPKKDSTDRARPKVKGWINKTEFVESVVVNDKPAFLVIDTETGKFSVKNTISTPTGIVRPLRKGGAGYMLYEFTLEEIEKINSCKFSLDEILDETNDMVQAYLAVPERDRILVVGNLVLTYCQEWISSVHYPYFVGEYGSGKTTAISLCGILGYRCLVTGSMTYAGIYNTLGNDEEGSGTIAEDEGQNMGRDKIDLYKDSYKKGKTVPRVRGANFSYVTYFKAFCCKWFAGTGVPDDDGLQERFAVVRMLGGKPEKSIGEAYSNRELMRPLHVLRNKLLCYKMKNIKNGFPKIESKLEGRDRELWNDFLSLFKGTKFEEGAKNTVRYYLGQRHDAIKERIDPKILTIIKPMIEENCKVSFQKMWDAITHSEELPGDLDVSGATFHPHFGEKITRNTFSKILREKFHAERLKDDGKRPKVTWYMFDMEVINILSKKYNAGYSL